MITIVLFADNLEMMRRCLQCWYVGAKWDDLLYIVDSSAQKLLHYDLLHDTGRFYGIETIIKQVSFQHSDSIYTLFNVGVEFCQHQERKHDVLWLNSDCFLPHDWREQYWKVRTEADLFSPLQYRMTQGEREIVYAGVDGWNHKLTLNDTWVDTFQSWATLGCLFVNANVEMPMFPTEYMLYCGDAEWTHKLFQKGYRIRFTPEIAVEHLEGAIIKAKYEPDELKQIWEADNRLFQERMK